MRKILITGINSYIGQSVEAWLMRNPNRYQITQMDLRTDEWKNKDFSKYDVIFHVAGIAHVSTDPKMEDLYFKVNRDLTKEVALKAMTEGIKQFIFMSSMIVYGKNQTCIDVDTIPQPENFYGLSKLQAEDALKALETKKFKVVVLRPPMIYGKGSKGNYPRLSKIAKVLPVFPKYKNRRSMLHIDNLCELIRLLIDNEESGTYYPQNSAYVNTSDLVKEIAKNHNHKIYLVKAFNPFIKILIKINSINKVFGDYYYYQDLSIYKKAEYRIRLFEESIYITEKER